MLEWYGRSNPFYSLWNRSVRLGSRVIFASLLVVTVGLFAATMMLYSSLIQQRALLAVTVRTSGWVAYQAQLEYVKAMAVLEHASHDNNPESLRQVVLRLELLSSRLAILYESEEGRMLPDIDSYVPMLQAFEARLDAQLAAVERITPGDAGTASTLRTWVDDLVPLGVLLQKLLMTSVAYNEELYARERELSTTTVVVPIVLIFLCGSALVSILLVQAARDRRHLREALAARAEKSVTRRSLRAALDAMPAVIVIFDPADDRVSYVNPAAAELVDGCIEHFAWAQFITACKEQMSARGEGPWGAISAAVTLPKGEVASLRGAAREISWEGRNRVMLALADTTKIRDAELQVMQAAKLATLGEMASAIAHELNQPLAVINMAAANALRLVTGGAEPAAVVAKLNRIAEQVERARRITDQVRRHGRMPAQHAVPFALRAAILNAIGFVAEQYRLAGIRLEIAVDLPPDLLVRGEQTMFEQVIVNLLVNARDALVELDGRETKPLARIAATANADQITVTVDDNAGGIRADIMDRLFDPFTTTKPADKGTGLGLALSRTVVRDMQGTIDAANLGAGARFTIVLPVAGDTNRRGMVA